MTLPTSEKLYQLLPKLYRMRDAGQGEPLRALLAIVEKQLDRVQNDVAQLYDNWFIETCDEWVVPYIGDLLGVKGYQFDQQSMSLRPFVANTLDYRRKKGTAWMLEGLAHDVTGWPARALEYFQLLGTTQHLNHRRKIDLRTPDLRDTDALELLDGPFEKTMHFAEVRRIAVERGKYNIPNVGLFLWRLGAYALDSAPAIPQPGVGAGRFSVSQLGRDAPLFNPPRTDFEINRIVESDVPGALRPRPLYDELEAARTALSQGQEPSYVYFQASRPSLRVFDATHADPTTNPPTPPVEIPPEQIQICDLSGWATALPPGKSVPLPTTPPSTLSTVVAVDPRLGRLAVVSTAPNPPTALLVSYRYGFSADLGGGTYPRPNPTDDGTLKIYPVHVNDRRQLVDGALADAINAWIGDQQPPALIELHENAIYDVPDLALPASGRLTIRAVDGKRPVLRPRTPWQLTLPDDAAFELSGVVVSGEPLLVTTQQASIKNVTDHKLTLEHCTLVPGLKLDLDGAPLSPDTASVQIAAGSVGPLALNIVRCITGRLDLGAVLCTLTASDSIIDAAGSADDAIAAAGDTTLTCVTVLGTVKARSMEASNVIFNERAVVERTQIGCVRFSYVARDSQLPRRYECQPDKAIDGLGDADKELVLARLVPSFTQRRYGDPGYAQLATLCPDEIKAGADDGAEMGAFHLLQQPQRLSNLAAALQEYLRFGLEAGVFLVT